MRVRHLREDDAVIECLDQLGRYLAWRMSANDFLPVPALANRLANQHRGSKPIDGCGHAAVSATYAMANAVNGKALDAASHTANAQVYDNGSYAAVADRE